MSLLGSWAKKETGSGTICLGTRVIKTLVNTRKQHISYLLLLREFVEQLKRGGNISFTNTILLGISEEIVWIFFDFCHSHLNN